MSTVTASTEMDNDDVSVASSSISTPWDNSSQPSSEISSDTAPTEVSAEAPEQTTLSAVRKARIAWAGAGASTSSDEESYIRLRPVTTTRHYSPPSKEISWSANTYDSLLEDNHHDEEDAPAAPDSFDSFFHQNPTRPPWPLSSINPEPTITAAETSGIIIPAQTRYELKVQKIQDSKNKNEDKPTDLPLFLDEPDAIPGYLSTYFHQPLPHWTEPHGSPEIDTTHIYPLSHTNTNPSIHGPGLAHPEWTQNKSYANTPLNPTWHTSCPFDNIQHSHDDPKTIYSSTRNETCKCFLPTHALKLTRPTLTHGEGASPQSNPKYMLCWTTLGSTGCQTLTHAIPYVGRDENRRRRVFVRCGQSFHLECAARYVKDCTGDGMVRCPSCGEGWDVSVGVGVRVEALVRRAGRVFRL